MARIIRANGTIEELSEAPTFKEAQRIVGGLVQALWLPGDEVLLCNEEGKLQGLLPNGVATARYGRHLLPRDIFVGDVIILEGKDEEKRTLG